MIMCYMRRTTQRLLLDRRLIQLASICIFLLAVLSCDTSLADMECITDRECPESQVCHYSGPNESYCGMPNFEPEPPSSDTLKLLTWNIHFLRPICLFSLCDDYDREAWEIAAFTDQNDIDIAMFQEAFHNPGEANLKAQLRARGYIHETHVPNGECRNIDLGLCKNSGVFISSKWPIIDVDQWFYGYQDDYGDWEPLCAANVNDCWASKGVIAARIMFGDKSLVVANTHLDAGGEFNDIQVRKKQLQQMADFVYGFAKPQELVFFGGDFNVHHPDVGNGDPAAEYPNMLETLNAIPGFDLGGFPPVATTPPKYEIDISNPSDIQVTSTGELLDYIMLSLDDNHPLPDQVIDYAVTSNEVSDHYPVVAEFDFLSAEEKIRLVSTETNGLFYVDSNGKLSHHHQNGGDWVKETIMHYGSNLDPLSLIRGGGTGIHEDVYGINSDGRLFSTYIDNDVITFVIIPGSKNLASESLAYSDYDGVFAVNTDGRLVRYYWDGSWKNEVISGYYGQIVPGSLIQGDFGKIYGVNKQGNLYITWSNSSEILFVSVNQDSPPLMPDSLVYTEQYGVFGISTDGALVRHYWDKNEWKFEVINPEFYHNMVSGSLISNGTSTVFGANKLGSTYTTWHDGSQLHFVRFSSSAPPTEPKSLAHSNLYDVFSITADKGELERRYWSNRQWNFEIIKDSLSDLIPESLVTAEDGSVYGVTAEGKIFTTSDDNGVISFSVLPE